MALLALPPFFRFGKVAGRHVQTTSLTLLGHSRLLLRLKPAVSRGKTPGVNLASERKRQIARFVVLCS